MDKSVAIIGAGAAGYYAANHIISNSTAKVILFEKANKVLSKVRISGGGRCNVTNVEEVPSKLAQNYPRGGKKLITSFKEHGSAQTKAWFTKKGLALKTEEDGRVFPVSDNSQDVITILRSVERHKNFDLRLQETINSIEQTATGYKLISNENTYEVSNVIVATGGNPTSKQLPFLTNFNLDFSPAFPSLFTFKIDDVELHKLSGLSMPKAICKIVGQKKLVQQGPMLITHWGLSGPAILKLSAFGANLMQDWQYKFQVSVNSLGLENRVEVEELVQNLAVENPKKKLINLSPEVLPKRYWLYLLNKAGINAEKPANEFGKKEQNKLIELLFNQVFEVNGKTTFKEEFVSGGGINLSNLSLNSFECKNYPNLYFCGEVCNVDGVTGGFNFQFAWTSAYLAAQDIVNN